MILINKNIFLYILVFAVPFIGSGSDLDIEDREQTDPLLVITNRRNGLLPETADLIRGSGIKIQTDRIPHSYKRMWGKRYVLMLHPINETRHASMSFSKITATRKGLLKLSVRNHPRGNHDIVIRRDGEIIEKEPIKKSKWIHFKIEFDRQPIVLEVHATGWNYEHSFIYYEIENSDSSSRR